MIGVWNYKYNNRGLKAAWLNNTLLVTKGGLSETFLSLVSYDKKASIWMIWPLKSLMLLSWIVQ